MIFCNACMAWHDNSISHCLRKSRIDGKLSPVSELTGWSSDYYKIPPEATELQDLIEHREMNFSVGNIFKATYRLGHKANTTAVYDLDKIIWFAQREKARILAKEAHNEDLQGHVDGT